MDSEKKISWWEKLKGFGGNFLVDKFGWDFEENVILLNNNFKVIFVFL